MATPLEKDLNRAIEELRAVQKEFAKTTKIRSQFESQLQENTLVKQELSLVEDGDGQVYKLIGPLLVKQDLAEARSNVDKRLEYIRKEIERYEKLMKETQEKEGKARDKCISIQRSLQQQQQQGQKVATA